MLCVVCFFFFFFSDPATTEIYALSLHDALPICGEVCDAFAVVARDGPCVVLPEQLAVLGSVRLVHLRREHGRSEEHTSELQSRLHLVCRLLLGAND